MKPENVRGIAKPRGVHPGKLSPTESFKTLQAGEARYRPSLPAALLLL